MKQECAPLTHAGARRAPKDVALAVQRYLLFAILACVPDRQRTLRELELNRTLFCEEFDEAVDVDVEVEEGGVGGGGGGGVGGSRGVGGGGMAAAVEMRWVVSRRWVVRHTPEDYKTGGAYGARPALVLDPRLYPALEAWLFHGGGSAGEGSMRGGGDSSDAETLDGSRGSSGSGRGQSGGGSGAGVGPGSGMDATWGGGTGGYGAGG